MTQGIDRDEVEEGTAPAIPLSVDKETLKAFYSGHRLPSPLGGHLELLAVREGDDGTGQAIFECSTSSLRFELAIKKATRTEKQKVKETQADGSDPTCPSHGSEQRLTLLGADWFCPQCGVRYGRAS